MENLEKKMSDRTSKVATANAKRILPPTYLLISIVAMIALHFLSPVMRIISFPWNLLGIVPLFLGVMLNLIANSAFQRAKTTVKPFEEASALITSGAFLISRNPMYLGFVLILIGVAILLGSLTECVVVLAFFVLISRVFVSVEERMLAKTFGVEWENYKRSTRRWL
ncbi:MAG: methyltransferase family protein [Thermoguttaceae bacterium]